MAVVKGVKEKVHLPLYDSLFVRPQRRLGEVSNSSVLRFFVNLQGKTKLETNMQSSSLLPHWNTFEARALRVVVSDLPARYPPPVEECLRQAGQTNGKTEQALRGCRRRLEDLIDHQQYGVDTWPQEASDLLTDVLKLTSVSDQAGTYHRHLDVLSALTVNQSLNDILRVYGQLHAARKSLAELMTRTRVVVADPAPLDRLAQTAAELGDEDLSRSLSKDLKQAPEAVAGLKAMAELLDDIYQLDYEKAVGGIEELQTEFRDRGALLERLQALRRCLEEVPLPSPCPPSLEQIRNRLLECIQDRTQIPAERQLAGRGSEILSQLVYHSVLTLSVGEKIMIQMPTWFFPAGAGPYSEDGSLATHGFPSPEATFRFAEPVYIDTQQNFKVEIEIPDAAVLTELQALYGPLLIWVVLDGYMVRDVQ